MVHGDVGSAGPRPSLAIDEAITLLDDIVRRLQSPKESAVEEKRTFVPPLAAPPKTPRKGYLEYVFHGVRRGAGACNLCFAGTATSDNAVPPEVSPNVSKSDAGPQNPNVQALLNRPGKMALKLPGVSAGVSSSNATVAKQSNEEGADHEANFDKAHFQVGVVHLVDAHPVADKLYVCKVETSAGQFKQVVAGLRKYVPVTDLEGKKVALILNLKPAKLVGQLSEGMILAGESLVDGELTVKTLDPPSSSSVGERIYLEGRSPSASPAKQLSSKIWEKIQPLLKVKGGVATFNQAALVTSSGPLQISGLPDGSGIR